MVYRKFSILWDIQENCWKKKPPGRKHSKGKALSYGNPCLFGPRVSVPCVIFLKDVSVAGA